MSVSSNDSPHHHHHISPATPPPPPTPPPPAIIDFHTNASPPHSSPLTPVSPSPPDNWSVSYHAVGQPQPLPLDFYHALFPYHPFLTPPPTSDSDYLERSYGRRHYRDGDEDADADADDITTTLVMSPKETLHPSPFPYPGGEQPQQQQPLATGGVSSERSTVSDNTSRAHGEHPGWPPKSAHPSGAMAHAPPTPGDAPAVSPLSAATPTSAQGQAGSMLPPIRTADGRPPATPVGVPNGHAQYPASYAYGYGYTPVQNAAGQTMYWHPPSNGGGDPYTPGMTPLTGFGMHAQQHGTIQPSAFNGWADREREDERPTIDRRESSTSTQQDRYMDKPLASPGMSQHSGEELVMVEVMYTSDCEVKQTQDVRRRCHNCSHTQPPSWRKSVLFPGKILCNKCGIFERTHRKSRPQQTDDQKLRKSTGYGQVEMLRANPSPMRFSKEEPQSPQSPYSTVPSQATPVSATSGFSSPISGHMPRRGSTSTSQPFSSPFAAGELRSVSFHPYQRPPISPSYLMSRRAASYAYPAPHGGYYAPSPTYSPYAHMHGHAYHQPGTPREIPAGPPPLMGTQQSAGMQGGHAHGNDAQMGEEHDVKPVIPAGPSTAGTMPPPEAHWPSRRHAEGQVHSAQ